MATSLPWSAVWTVARERLRRRRAGSIGLVLLAGLGAALPMAVWAASRDTSPAYSSFVEAVEPRTRPWSSARRTSTPPGHGPGPASPPGHRRARRHQGRSARPAGRPLRLPPTGLRPHRRSEPAAGVRCRPPHPRGRAPTASVLGDPIVVSGRLPRADAPDEAMTRRPPSMRSGSPPATGCGPAPAAPTRSSSRSPSRGSCGRHSTSCRSAARTPDQGILTGPGSSPTAEPTCRRSTEGSRCGSTTTTSTG